MILGGAGSTTGAAPAGGLDIGSIEAQIAGGGVGGSVLMAIVGLSRQMTSGGQGTRL